MLNAHIAFGTARFGSFLCLMRNCWENSFSKVDVHDILRCLLAWLDSVIREFDSTMPFSWYIFQFWIFSIDLSSEWRKQWIKCELCAVHIEWKLNKDFIYAMYVRKNHSLKIDRKCWQWIRWKKKWNGSI